MLLANGRARRVIGDAEHPAFSADGRKVAADRFDTASIVARPLRAGARTRRVVGRQNARNPSWAPNGRTLVFDATVRYADAYLFTVRRDGTGLHRLVLGEGPSWSVRDTLAFNCGTSDGICTMAAGGGPVRRVLRGGTSPDWSPDGRRLAYERRGWVYVTRADGGGRRRVARGAAPAWAPDGHVIAFTHAGSIWTATPRGHGLRRFLRCRQCSDPAWQPIPR